MLSLIHSTLLSTVLALGVVALPAESPNGVFAKLAERKVCNADLCLGMLTNRPLPATAYCTSLLSQTPGTVTITAWVSSTATPAPASTTLLVGTTTTATAYSTSTYTSDQTVFYKRSQDATATDLIASLIPLSCTSSQNAAVTYRASSACSCLLSTSTTVTVTSTSISTVPASTITSTSSYASTSTTTIGTAITTISTISVPTPSCNLIQDPSFEAIPVVMGGSRASNYWIFGGTEGIANYGSFVPQYGQMMLLMQMSTLGLKTETVSQVISGLSTTSTYTLTYNYWMYQWSAISCTMSTTSNGISLSSPFTFNGATGGASMSYKAGTPWPSQSFTFTPDAPTATIEVSMSCVWPATPTNVGINFMLDNFSFTRNNNPDVCI